MNYYIANRSCGKDSLAMVLRLIEEGKPLDEIPRQITLKIKNKGLNFNHNRF